MTQSFYPPILLRNDKTGAAWHLTISDGKLALADNQRGVKPLGNAANYTIVERIPVTGWLVGIIWDLWKEFAPYDEAGGRHHGGVEALKRAEDALRTAGLIESDGVPRQMTPPLGAGGMEEK